MKTGMGTSIFISYRRVDSSDVTGRIYDRLVSTFDRNSVFKDVDSIPFGVDFREHLDGAVSQCQVCLVVVGRTWLEAKDEAGRRRLDSTQDFVRIEIESALKRKIPVIPVLVGGASMPKSEQLPPSLEPLAYRNGAHVRSDPDFHRDMDRLIAGIQQHFGNSQPPSPPPSAPQDNMQKSPSELDSALAEIIMPPPLQTRDSQDKGRDYLSELDAILADIHL
jgi:hypothetical protein